MTTNQTIDGVPLAELKFDERLFHVSKTWKGCGRGWVKFICDEGDGCVRVRCENGAIPIVKLCNLQTLAVTDEQELAEFYDELSNGGALARRALTHIKALHLANKPSAQPQGEPVAYVDYSASGGVRWRPWEHGNLADGAPLFSGSAEQPAPVAVVLPERKHVPDFIQHPMLNKEYAGWNACLDEVTRLNTKPTCCGSCPGGCVIQAATK